MATNRFDEMRKVMIAKTIVDNGSIQRAAKVLKVTPSAISQSLTSLEKKIGVPLFIREKGKITPTKQCLSLLEKAQPAFLAIDSVFAEEQNSMQIGSLDLGTYESLAFSFLPKFVAKIRTSHPEIKINIKVKRTAEIIKKLRSGELCTAIVVESDCLDGINCVEIAKEELGLYISSRFQEKVKDWEFISQLGFGMLSNSTDGTPNYLKKFIKQLGKRPKISISSDSFEVLALAAKEGLSSSILPKRVADRLGDDLIEVKTLDGVPKHDRGLHSIYLASLDKCDQEEAEYLANIARTCL